MNETNYINKNKNVPKNKWNQVLPDKTKNNKESIPQGHYSSSCTTSSSGNASNRLYISGGIKANTNNNESRKPEHLFLVYSYDIYTNYWKKLSFSNTSSTIVLSRYGHLSAIYNDTLYIFGGFLVETDACDKKLLIYSTLLDKSQNLQWKSIQPNSDIIYLQRGMGVGGVYYNRNGESMFVIHGGMYKEIQGSIQISLSDVWGYFFHNNTLVRLRANDGGYTIVSRGAVSSLSRIRSISHAPIARFAHAGAIYEQELVIHGGIRISALGIWRVLGDVWAFDLEKYIWREVKKTMPKIWRAYHSLVVTSDGSFVAFGGSRTSSIKNTRSEALMIQFHSKNLNLSANEINQNTWYLLNSSSHIAPIPNRAQHSACILNYDTMYIWGGRTTQNQLLEHDGIWTLQIDSQYEAKLRQTPAELPTRILSTFAKTFAIVAAFSFIVLFILRKLFRRWNAYSDWSSSLVEAHIIERTGELHRFHQDTRSTTQGLSQSTIDQLPLQPYSSFCTSKRIEAEDPQQAQGQRQTNSKSLTHEPSSKHQHMDQSYDNYCIICHVEYSPEEQIRILPCSHYFHKDCIDLWLLQHISCPTCRTKVFIQN